MESTNTMLSRCKHGQQHSCLECRIEVLETERAGLQAIITAERIACPYCDASWCAEDVASGKAFAPGTPAADQVKIHVQVCPKHPMRALQQEREQLRQALQSLANEAHGFLSMADKSLHGVTNMRCLQNRIDEARAALKGGAAEGARILTPIGNLPPIAGDGDNSPPGKLAERERPSQPSRFAADDEARCLSTSHGHNPCQRPLGHEGPHEVQPQPPAPTEAVARLARDLVDKVLWSANVGNDRVDWPVLAGLARSLDAALKDGGEGQG